MKESHSNNRISLAARLAAAFVLTCTLALGAAGSVPDGLAAVSQNSRMLDQPKRVAAPVAPDDSTENVRFINHQGGETGPVVVQGSYAYAVFAGELAILDASVPTQPVRLGHILLPRNILYLAVAEDYAFAAVEAGLYVIDMRDPS